MSGSTCSIQGSRMTKGLVKFLYLLAICLAQTMCDVDSTAKQVKELDSLITTAHARVKDLKDLQDRANVLLYAKLNRYVGESVQQVVGGDLTNVRTLIANSSSQHVDSCYIGSLRKIRSLGRKAFTEMKPCNQVATAVIKDYLGNFTVTLQTAGNVTEKLETLRKTCASSGNTDECVGQASTEGTNSVALLEETVLNSMTNMKEAAERVIESSAPCFEGLFNNTRTKTHEVVVEVQDCLQNGPKTEWVRKA